MQKKAYSVFARYYDKYMADVEYDEWVDFVLSSFSQQRNRSPQRILELACGTGNVASRLVRRGFEVDASDCSEAMLEIAKKKPFPAQYKNADLLNELPENQYDLILLLFDSINYLLEEADIFQLLDNIQGSLSEEGIFIIDVSTQLNSKKNFDGFVNINDDETGYIVQESNYNQQENLQINHLTFFLPENGHYLRFDEHHRQRIYPLQRIISIIEKSTLNLLGIFRLAENRELVIPTEEYGYADRIYNRIFFVTEK